MATIVCHKGTNILKTKKKRYAKRKNNALPLAGLYHLFLEMAFGGTISTLMAAVEDIAEVKIAPLLQEII